MKARALWAFALLFLFLSASAPPDEAFAAKEDVVVGLVAEPVSFDVPTITDLNTMRVLRRVFEGLTDLKLGTYEVGPGLAESWTISEDGKVRAKRLVQVEKPYRTVPDFYGKALATAAAGKPPTPRDEGGGG